MKRRACQPLVDTKAFKGKGSAWQMLQCVGDDLRAVWRDMEALAHESSADAPTQAPAYVQVHRITGLSKQGAVRELRWRLRQRDHDSHVLWPQVEALLANQAIAVRRYYWHLNQRMLDLNCIAGTLRQVALRLLARLSDRADPKGEDQHFAAWIKGELSLADFDMRQPTFHTEDKAE